MLQTLKIKAHSLKKVLEEIPSAIEIDESIEILQWKGHCFSEKPYQNRFNFRIFYKEDSELKTTQNISDNAIQEIPVLCHQIGDVICLKETMLSKAFSQQFIVQKIHVKIHSEFYSSINYIGIKFVIEYKCTDVFGGGEYTIVSNQIA